MGVHGRAVNVGWVWAGCSGGCGVLKRGLRRALRGQIAYGVVAGGGSGGMRRTAVVVGGPGAEEESAAQQPAPPPPHAPQHPRELIEVDAPVAVHVNRRHERALHAPREGRSSVGQQRLLRAEEEPVGVRPAIRHHVRRPQRAARLTVELRKRTQRRRAPPLLASQPVV